MFASEPVPRSVEELRQEPRRFTFGQHLERYGGYQSQRELGLVMHMLTQVADTLLAGETEAALDLISLMMVCVEQVAQDGGKWEVGYTLSLFPEPAPQVHFLQLWGHPDTISQCLQALGWATGPCIDPKASAEYDPSSLRVLSGLLILSRRGGLMVFACAFLSPPSTSVAQAPREGPPCRTCRSRKQDPP